MRLNLLKSICAKFRRNISRSPVHRGIVTEGSTHQCQSTPMRSRNGTHMRARRAVRTGQILQTSTNACSHGLALQFILISSAQENVLQLLCRGCTRIPATCSGWRSVTGSTLYRPMAVCSTISGESTHQLHTKISVDNLEIVLKLISPNFSAFASD